MKRKLTYIIAAIAVLSIGVIIYGFTVREANVDASNTYIGFGTVGLFLVAMPLFLIVESRGKDIKDYMLTEENIRKMRKGNSKKTEDQ